MEAKFKFEKLKIWNISMEMGEAINTVVDNFPNKELFNLSSQMRRASDSIALNIAEGSIGQSNPEQRKFIGYAIRSLAEIVTCLHKAKNRDYISKELFNTLYLNCYELMNMMTAFRKKLV